MNGGTSRLCSKRKRSTPSGPLGGHVPENNKCGRLTISRPSFDFFLAIFQYLKDICSGENTKLYFELKHAGCFSYVKVLREANTLTAILYPEIMTLSVGFTWQFYSGHDGYTHPNLDVATGFEKASIGLGTGHCLIGNVDPGRQTGRLQSRCCVHRISKSRIMEKSWVSRARIR